MAFFRRPRVRVTLVTLFVLYVAAGPVTFVVWRPSLADALLALPVAALTLGGYLIAMCGQASDRQAWWLLLLSLSGASVMHVAAPYSGTSFFFVVIFLAPFRLRTRLAGLLTTVDILAWLLVSYAIRLEASSVLGVAAGLAYCAVLAFLLQHLSVTRRQTAEVAEARAREAVLSERARLAREVHDILAHTQSAQIVHLEGVRLLLKEDGDRALALDRVERAVRLARSSLEETRRALDALREDALPLTERLERFAAEFQAATGARCALSVDTGARALPAEAGLAVARTAQEALTNVCKHAPGASVSVAVRRRGRWCELVVRDDGGQRAGTAPAGNGYGLVGMRERAELLGGSLSAKAEEKGFAVVLRVPV